MITNLTIIRRSLTARMFSTVTTVVTVAVAVGLMLILLSMRESGERAFARGTGNMHLLVSKERDRLVSVLHAIFYTAAPGQYIEWAEYQSILSRFGDGPRGPGPLEFLIPIQQGDTYRGFPVTATTPEFFTLFSPDQEFSLEGGTGDPWQLREGGFIEDKFDVVLGSDVANATDLAVGDHLHMSHGASGFDEAGGHVHDEFEWHVAGILEATGSAHDRAVFSHIESSWIVHALDRIEREEAEHAHDEGDDHDHAEEAAHAEEDHATGEDHADHIEPADIVLTDEDRKITGLLLRARGRPGRQMSTLIGPVAFELNRDFTVAEPRTEVTNLFRIVGNVGDILLGMAVVVMVSSGIAILLALYNSMEQRRRQIAVLRVLGCSQRRIFGLVIGESAAIGLAGAVAAIVLWFPASSLVATVMRERLGIVVEPALEWFFVLPVVGGTILLACLAGVIPATVAYRTSVARNLRPIG